MTETPTPDEIARWAAQADSATPGPWHQATSTSAYLMCPGCEHGNYVARAMDNGHYEHRHEALVAAQAEQNAELRGEVERYRRPCEACGYKPPTHDHDRHCPRFPALPIKPSEPYADRLEAELARTRADLAALRATDEYQRWARAVAERDAAREAAAKLLDAILSAIRNEDDHSHFNGHRLDRDCQGVAPGEHVPAIRTVGVWASLAGALRHCGVPFPEAYRGLLDPEPPR